MKRFQRGATLIVSLIILVLITLMVASAMKLSNSNLKAVGNMQFRNEAIAAANKAIEDVVSSSFAALPAARTIEADIDNDGKTDYVVEMTEPVCLRALPAYKEPPSSIALQDFIPPATRWETVWEITSRVSAIDNPGEAEVTVRSGVRILVSDLQKEAFCP